MPAHHMPSSPAYIDLPHGIRMVPVAHGVLSFTNEVRRAVEQVQPRVIAVELPRALGRQIVELVEALPEIRLLAYKIPGEPPLMIPADPCDALIEAVRLAREHNIRLELVDTLRAGSATPHVALPDAAAAERIGLRRYTEICLRGLPQRPPDERDRVMAARLESLAAEGGPVLFVGGLGHARPIRTLLHGKGSPLAAAPEEDTAGLQVRVAALPEEQLDLVLREMPRVAWLYENFRDAHGPEDAFPQEKALKTILRRAASQYHEEYDEEIALTEWRTLSQFLRNISAVRGRLRPGIYELLTAAKSCIDGDYGAIVYEIAASYPPNTRERTAGMPPGPVRRRSLALHADFGEGKERLLPAYSEPERTEFVIKFRRRMPTKEEQLFWQMNFARDLWTGSGICSYPPEDAFIENFFRRIQERATLQLTEELHAVEEFTTGMMDGLDARETMRRWHEGKVFVRRERRRPGNVGPVVLLWHDLALATPNVWRTCLYAEDNNESDLALFSQQLGRHMVGPGITRSEYFGVLSVYPAIGIPDIWHMLPPGNWSTHGQVLAAAAVLLSEERYIAYVAQKPPDPYLREFARAHGREFRYLPLASFSKAAVKKARRFHILASKQARAWAGDYIP